MKGIKKISLLALALAFVAGAAACTNNNANDSDVVDNGDNGNGGGGNVTPVDPDPITPPEPEPDPVEEIPDYVEFETLEAEIGSLTDLEQPSNYPGVYINPENKLQYRLMTISIYTSQARTKFYLGEEFNADGLIVLAQFNKLNEDGTYAKDADGKTISILARVTNYEVDGSNIDTSVLGFYTAQVNYRFGETVKTAEYTVSVRSSEFETTKNLVYIAGIKAGYNSNVGGTNFILKNDGRIATTYLRKNGTNDFAFDISQINIKLVKNTVNGVASAFRTEYLDFDTSTLVNDTTNKKITSADNSFVLDYSSVDTGKVGSYIIPITYKAEDLQISGRTVENVVQSFIVVDVISPITALRNTNSTLTTEASMSLPDFSDYKVTLSRKVWDGSAIVTVNSRIPVTSDYFKFENIVTYSQGTQNGIFVLKEIGEDENGNEETFSFEASVVVNASTVYDITVKKDVSAGTVINSSTASDGKVTYVEYDLGNGVKAYNVGAGKPDKNGTPEYLGKTHDCAEDGLRFAGFLGLDSSAKGSYIEFTFTKKTTLILYIGSNGDDDRGFVITQGNQLLYEEMVEVSVAGAKQTPIRKVYEFEAGTYKVSAQSSTVTFHGYVIGSLK